jgi:hypothetical protein
MVRCSHLYLTTVLLLHQQMTHAAGLKNLLHAAACSAASGLASDTRDESSTQQLYPAWFASARPPADMQQLVIDWQVPLRDLRVLVEHWLQDGYCETLCSSGCTWQGSTCNITLEVDEDDDSEEQGPAGAAPVSIGCYMRLHRHDPQLCRVVCQILRWTRAQGTSTMQ